MRVYKTTIDLQATLLTGVARIYEAVGNLGLSAKYYKTVLVVNV